MNWRYILMVIIYHPVSDKLSTKLQRELHQNDQISCCCTYNLFGISVEKEKHCIEIVLFD